MNDYDMASLIISLVQLSLWIWAIMGARSMARKRNRRPWVWGWFAVFFFWLSPLILAIRGDARMSTSR